MDSRPSKSCPTATASFTALNLDRVNRPSCLDKINTRNVRPISEDSVNRNERSGADTAQLLDRVSKLSDYQKNADSWSSTASAGTPTEEDIGDVWDEDEASFADDEVYRSADDETAESSEYPTQNPPVTSEPVQSGSGPDGWALEDIPEEEAAELLAIVTAAEEYLSSVASGGANAQHSTSISRASKQNKPTPIGHSGSHEIVENVARVSATVGLNSSNQRKQMQRENSRATASLNDYPASNNKWNAKIQAATASLTSVQPPVTSHRSVPEEAAEVQDISLSAASIMDSFPSAHRRLPSQLKIFSIGDTKFPDSPTTSKHENVSTASHDQSSRMSARSLRSTDHPRSGHHGNQPTHTFNHFASQFKVSKSINPCPTDKPNQVKFRGSPPPPIPDFRPGSPPDADKSPPLSKRQTLDSGCLSKLASDIERLLSQLDSDLPEEKARCRALIRDHDRYEETEFRMDKRDFRKSYCCVLAVDTTKEEPVAQKSTFQSTPMFSPCSDEPDLSFYSGDDGEASLILDSSTHTDIEANLDKLSADENGLTAIITTEDRENASATVCLARPKLSKLEKPKFESSPKDDNIRKEEKLKSQSPSPPEETIRKMPNGIMPRSICDNHSTVDDSAPVRYLSKYNSDGSSRNKQQQSQLRPATSITCPTIPTYCPPPHLSSRQSVSHQHAAIESANKSNMNLHDEEEIKKKLEDKIRTLQKLLREERELRDSAEESEQRLRQRLEQIERKLQQVEKQLATQTETDSKREHEFNQLRSEAERACRNHQMTVEALKREHANVVASIEEQLNTLRYEERNKAENECAKLRSQRDQAQHELDSVTDEKRDLEEQRHQMELKALEYQMKSEQLERNFSQTVAGRQKTQVEKDTLGLQLREFQAQIAEIEKKKTELQRQLNLVTFELNDEIERRKSLLEKVKELETENRSLRDSHLQHEDNKKDLTRRLNKATLEISSLQSKLQQCGSAQTEHVERQKKYYVNKLDQAQQENETLTGRVTFLERIRSQLRLEIDELNVDLKKAGAAASGYDKRTVALDNAVRDWETKYNELSGKVMGLEEELSLSAFELQRSKMQLEEATEEAAALRLENQKLTDEITELRQHVNEVTEALQELEEEKKLLLDEKDELEELLRQREEETMSKAQELAEVEAELINMQDSIDAEMEEKFKEFEEEKFALQNALTEVKAAAEGERRAKENVVQRLQILQTKVDELEKSLELANKSRLDALNRAKRLSEQNQELCSCLEQLKSEHTMAMEKCLVTEKRAGILQKEREEMAATLIQVEQSRQELIEEAFAMQRDGSERESAFNELKAAKDEMESLAMEARAALVAAARAAEEAEEKANMAEAEKCRLAEAMKHERSKAFRSEQTALDLEFIVKDLQNKVDRFERNRFVSSDVAVARLEQTIRELEDDLRQERQRAQEAIRAERGSERIIKELHFQVEQERLQAGRMADAVENLERKLKMYKRQREEAEDLASTNIAKCRELQHELGSVEGRADAAENVLSRIRSENRARISGLVPNITTPLNKPLEISSLSPRRMVSTVVPKRHQSTALYKRRTINSLR